MQGFAINPDSAFILLSLLAERRPAVALDLGSGVSTVLMALAMDSFGIGGRVVSVEHDDTYLASTRRLLVDAGVEDRVELVHAPLREQTVGDETYRWYDRRELPPLSDVGLLFIDGPPGSTQPQVRYPALPLLADALAVDPVIVIDDTTRQHERTIVQRWDEARPDLTFEAVRAERGCTVGYPVGRRPVVLDQLS